LEKEGISANILTEVENTSEKTINCVKINKVLSAWFETRSELRREHISTDIV
jgi:hypothetical protein